MSPPTDIDAVLDAEVKEWHFHIYLHQKNEKEKEAALALRDGPSSISAVPARSSPSRSFASTMDLWGPIRLVSAWNP
jgi:hypothetical protein